MARKFVVSLDLNKNELLNARIQNLSSAPSSPVAGQVYFNTSDSTLYFYNGSAWIPASGSTEVIQDLIGSSLIGGTGLTASYNDTSGETTVDLDNTAVTHGSYGSSAAKTVTFTVDQQGRLTAASEQDIAIATSQVTGLQEFIEDSVNTVVVAGEGIDVSYNDISNTYTISGEDASDTNKGIASFSSTDFTVTSGNVTINHESIADIVGSMTTGNTETGITVTYQDADNTIDFAVDDQFPSHSTSDLAEGTNLYYTSERVQDDVNTAIVAGTGLDKTYDDGAGTITLDIDSTVTTNSGTQTLTNKTLGSGTTLGANLNANSAYITSLADPLSAQDAATKAYVDARVNGMAWKQAVNLLSSSNISDFTDVLSLTIDGHTVDVDQIGYRVLLTSQSTDSENGLYEVVAATGSNISLTRSSDADSYSELIGASLYVMEGTSYASTTWVQSNHYLTDFTSQNWVQSSGAGTYSAGGGLTLTGTSFSVDVTPSSGNAGLEISNSALNVKVDTASGLTIGSNGLAVNPGTGLTFNSGALTFDSGYGVRKHSESIGDGTNTSYTVTHNLSTRDVTVQMYEVSSPYSQVEAEVEYATTNTVTIKFASAPTSNQYRVVVLG